MGLLIALLLALQATPAQPDEIVNQLAKIQIDKSQIYNVRDITFRRDVLSISLNRGTIAFTEAVGGKITGAVFLGSGEILAIPPDRVEKQQLYRYTKAALLNEHFETAVFRFTDGMHDEFLKEYRTHAHEDVDPERVSEILRWNAELQRRGRFLNERILKDLLGSPSSPLFLAQLEGVQLGWFDAIYDERSTEEIVIEQSVTGGGSPIVWASFNKRSQAREAALHAHEDKSVTDLIGYSANGPVGSLRLRWKTDGERVFEIPVASGNSVSSVSSSTGQELSFLEGNGHISVIASERGRRGNEIAVRITYTKDAPQESGYRNARAETVMAASYRDQWIIEGLSRYAEAVARNSLGIARLQLLQESPEGGSYESIGPVSIGFRMIQPGTTDGYVSALANKSVWIIHMLRLLIRRGEDDTPFADFVLDFQQQFSGKIISTSEFQQLVEKHAGKELDWFFEQWVLGTGIPTYRVDYKIEPAAGSFVVEGSISQSGVPENFTMPVPLYADETLLGRVTVSSDEGSFRFTVKNRPKEIRVDPEGTILAVIGQGNGK